VGGGGEGGGHGLGQQAPQLLGGGPAAEGLGVPVHVVEVAGGESGQQAGGGLRRLRPGSRCGALDGRTGGGVRRRQPHQPLAGGIAGLGAHRREEAHPGQQLQRRVEDERVGRRLLRHGHDLADGRGQASVRPLVDGAPDEGAPGVVHGDVGEIGRSGKDVRVGHGWHRRT
jgi:hypothetical protein